MRRDIALAFTLASPGERRWKGRLSSSSSCCCSGIPTANWPQNRPLVGRPKLTTLQPTHKRGPGSDPSAADLPSAGSGSCAFAVTGRGAALGGRALGRSSVPKWLRASLLRSRGRGIVRLCRPLPSHHLSEKDGERRGVEWWRDAARRGRSAVSSWW